MSLHFQGGALFLTSDTYHEGRPCTASLALPATATALHREKPDFLLSSSWYPTELPVIKSTHSPAELSPLEYPQPFRQDPESQFKILGGDSGTTTE